MRTKRCPKCGEILIEETQESDAPSSAARNIPAGSSNFCGSIDYYVAPNTKIKTTFYRCPNPECGYLSTDC